MSTIRNRIVRHASVRAGDLVPHELNPRTHPHGQRRALTELYQEVGFARSLLAFELPDGRLKLIDGHLRRDIDPEMVVAVEILDVDEEEARKLLLSIDPLAMLAGYDDDRLSQLRQLTTTQSANLANLWASIGSGSAETEEALAKAAREPKAPARPQQQFLILVECADESAQLALLERFAQEGLTCRAMLSRPMPISIVVESQLVESPRVAQIRGLFDLPIERTSRLEWSVNLPLEDRPWNVGLITGPSGCGKSTIARTLWPVQVVRSGSLAWEADRALVDRFPAGQSIKEVAALLSAVGFSSPPAWLLPFPVLSTGQQFRVTLARLLAETLVLPESERDCIVFDEFTSVVDRTVARVGSAALARTVRSQNLRFVAVTCHDDIIDWLQPDWVYRPVEDLFTWRLLRRRPAIALEVQRCDSTAWRLFAPHHYLSHALAPSAWSFVACWENRPVAFSAWLPFVGTGRPARREHRTVTLPDFQGVGIGHAMSGLIASMWRGLGFRALSTTTHPGLIHARQRSPFWVLRRAPSLAAGRESRLPSLRHATTRLTAGFEYTGPSLPRVQALRLLRG